ncbi:MAG: hypothetical protein HRU03_00480 [Nanoarchaeales archaeon]|nr:hypothetical protein [Nanoarchaeales archaeon]
MTDLNKQINIDKIVCVGSLNVDVTLFVDEFCKEDEERSINEITNSSGGAAANIAAGIGKLNKNVYFFGNVGTDRHTNMLLKDFKLDNVNYSIAKVSEKPNNSCYSIVDKTSQRIMYAYNYLNFDETDFPTEFYNEKLKYLVFTSLVSKDILKDYCTISKKAKINNTKIIFSPGNIFVKFGLDTIKELISLSDYLILSESEFKILNIEINKLLNICSKVLITKGKNGVEFFELNKDKMKFEALKINNPIDSTGAGDCFLAALVSELFENKTIEKAIQFGIRAAAVSVTTKGARGMQTLEQIKNFK